VVNHFSVFQWTLALERGLLTPLYCASFAD